MVGFSFLAVGSPWWSIRTCTDAIMPTSVYVHAIYPLIDLLAGRVSRKSFNDAAKCWCIASSLLYQLFSNMHRYTYLRCHSCPTLFGGARIEVWIRLSCDPCSSCCASRVELLPYLATYEDLVRPTTVGLHGAQFGRPSSANHDHTLQLHRTPEAWIVKQSKSERS